MSPTAFQANRKGGPAVPGDGYGRLAKKRLRTTIARCATNNAPVATISITMMSMSVSHLQVFACSYHCGAVY